MKSAVLYFWKKPIFSDYRFILLVWVGLSLFVGVARQLMHGIHGNYQIYKNVFFHFVDRVSLYPPPTPALDTNHYGPLFSLIIAPFAILPDLLGASLWLLISTLLLFYAIRQLPLQRGQHAVIYWFGLNMLYDAMLNVQFNITIATIIILSFTCIKKEKDMWAALAIMIGAYVKLYGIVGLAFFFFSKHKLKFVVWCIIWAVVLFALPMLFSSPGYIIEQYHGWFESLLEKNHENTFAVMQDISVFGMLRRVTGDVQLSNLPVLITGLLLFAASYFRVDRFRSPGYQFLLLASVLLFTVLFSTGSEQNTYVIAMIGVAVWFVIQPRPVKIWQWSVLAFAFFFCCMAPSDLFPRFLFTHFMRPYSLMALPCLVVWLIIVYQMIFGQSERYQTGQ